MATCYPDYGNDESAFTSRGELIFYQACQSLPSQYRVFHSVSWIARSDGKARDGEADFLICHPDSGFLVVEVKGGRIHADLRTNRWTSTDKNGQAHQISNPFLQAAKGKHNIIVKLKEHREWPGLGLHRVIAGHAAFFPNVDDGRALQGPEAPPEIIGDHLDIPRLEQWVECVFGYWVGHKESRNSQPLGLAGVELMQRIFARTVEARPLLSTQIEEEEKERLALTRQQIKTLDFFSRQRRVAISGGAGTGKTVLAAEKARRLAAEGFKTLLTCYNDPLSDHLRQVCAHDENLDVTGFHKLCENLVNRAKVKSERDLLVEAEGSHPGKNLWNYHYPVAATCALEILDDRYDAIVVDEGQDFGEEFWFLIELLLKDSDESPLYIFYDENQNVYDQASTFPAGLSPITLWENCRNTKQIHQAAYRYYSGAPVSPPPLAGENIHILDAPSVDRQAKKIGELVTRFITQEKIPASSIVVLMGDRKRRKIYENTLGKFRLPTGYFWNKADNRTDQSVTVETVARFKGLEGGVLILWGLEGLPSGERRKTLYTGLSRAKSILYLCGSRSTCEAVLAGE